MPVATGPAGPDSLPEQIRQDQKSHNVRGVGRRMASSSA